MRGILFDIQRCSLHDGPGIRTTVFIKGCPLRCLWCHNPESVSFKPQVSYNSSKCCNCLGCVNACNYGVQKIKEETHVMDFSACTACGKCISACNFNALKMIGEEWDSKRLMLEIVRDKEYYQHSGGGVTLSGGEPMAQFEFSKEILSLSKEDSIHTCIETSGFAPQEKYLEILNFVDIFLFDYKATNSKKHRELTGVSNDLILLNLDFLYNKGASIILRCPMVSGINDSFDHLEGIANISVKYPRLIGIEIMPYHDMGKGKGLQLGKDYPLKDLKTTDEDTKKQWLDTLRSLGCTNIKIS